MVPMKLPLHTASGAVEQAALVLVDLETTAGVTGRAYLLAYSRANLAPIVALLEAMGEMLAGDPVAPVDIERKLRAKYTLLGVHNIVLFAMSGIDMAAWDALGQSLGQPLSTLLGGTPRAVRAYNSKGLGLQPLPKLVKQARALLDEGFDALKLRLGRADARDDLAALRAVKKAIGDQVTLMVDFNQGLTVAEAIRRGHQIDAEGGVLWIEEPVRADDFAGCARVAHEIRTPIQIGENFMGPEQMVQALAAGACDYVMPDLQRIGGVTGLAARRGAGAGRGHRDVEPPVRRSQCAAVSRHAHRPLAGVCRLGRPGAAGSAACREGPCAAVPGRGNGPALGREGGEALRRLSDGPAVAAATAATPSP